MRLDIRCVGKKALRLARGQRLKIGRGEENDLVLTGQDISRAHAELVWDRDQDRPEVVDLHSSNGMRLAGEVVDDQAPIRDSCTLEIGTYELHLDLVLRPRDGRGSERFNLHDSSGEFFIDMRGPRVEGRFRRPEQLHAVLRQIEVDQRTGTLVLDCETVSASITIAKGRGMQAEYEHLTGLDALERILAMQSGTYRLAPMCKPTDAYLDVSFSGFLRRGI